MRLYPYIKIVSIIAALAIALPGRFAVADPPIHSNPDYMQVAIEALVVEVNRDHTRDIGIEWVFNRNESRSPDKILEGVTGRFPTRLDPVRIPVFNDEGDLGGFALGQVTREPGIGAVLAGMDIANSGRVSANLRALMEEGEAEVRTRPIAVTLNKHPVKIQTTDNVPFQDIEFDKRGEEKLAVNFQDVGTVLEVVPRIQTPLETQRIELDIKQLEVSNVSNFITIRQVSRPVFVESSANTQVILHNAETLVIGGLKSRREVVNEKRLPILGRIPLLGWAFKNQRKQVQETDILFFITPYILPPGVNPILPFDYENEQILTSGASEQDSEG